jgi:hypothetical protein
VTDPSLNLAGEAGKDAADLNRLKGVLFFSALLGLVFIFLVLKSMGSGLDFTDESAYLFYIKYPWAYDATVSQFGLIYHPLFMLARGDIFLLRLFNTLIILAIYARLSYLLLLNLKPENLPISIRYLSLLIPALSAVPLSALVIWLPTPNYNLLNVQAIGLILIAVFQISGRDAERGINEFSAQKTLPAEKNPRSWTLGNIPSWLLIGAGGYMAFMAKPQTAVGLAFLVLLWVFLSKRRNFKSTALAAFFSFLLLFISALILDGSVAGFVSRYISGVAIDRLAGTHQVSDILNFDPRGLFAVIDARLVRSFFFCLGIGILYYYSAERKNWLLGLIILLACVTALFFINPYWGGSQLSLGHLLWAGLFGGAAVDYLKGRKKNPGGRNSKIAWFLFISSLSVIYSLGSNNFFLIPLSVASFLIFYGFLVFLAREPKPLPWLKKVAGYTCLGQFMAIAIVLSSWAAPYRQASRLWDYNTQAKVPIDGSPLSFSPMMASFINKWYEIAKSNGFKPQTPVIDLTGRTPGAIYIIGGVLPKTPWIYSGYRSSEAFAVTALKKLTCRQLSEAWLIIDLNFEGILNPAILPAAGVDLDGEYTLLGRADYPLPSREGFVSRPLGLLAPANDPRERADICQKRRASWREELTGS